MSLEDDGTQFDQFKGKKSTYHDNLYTTELKEDQITEEQKRYALQIEKEILNSGAGTQNRHIREERGIEEVQDDEDSDEEMKYSGVVRGKKPKPQPKPGAPSNYFQQLN